MVDEFVRLLKSYPVGEQDREWFVRWIKRYQEFGRFGANVRFEVERTAGTAIELAAGQLNCCGDPW